MNSTRASRDTRPSLRLLVAAARLRAGQSTDDVARNLGIPLALVTLIAEEQRGIGA